MVLPPDEHNGKCRRSVGGGSRSPSALVVGWLIDWLNDWLINYLICLGVGVPGQGYIRSGCEVLSSRQQWHSGYQNTQESSLLCSPGPARGLHSVETSSGECRSVQRGLGIRVLQTSWPLVPSLWNAWTELVRFPQRKPISARCAKTY